MKDWLPRLVARAPFTVHTKLIGAFFAIVALLIIFGIVVLQVLGGINRRSEELSQAPAQGCRIPSAPARYDHSALQRHFSAPVSGGADA